jgi:hypothetical protein
MVICCDYGVIDKLSAQSFEARIVGYTYIHGVYNIIDSTRKQRVVKDPKPVIEPENNSDKSTTKTRPFKLAKQTIHKDESTKPIEETSIEPPPMK